jgi:hypothetical protein
MTTDIIDIDYIRKVNRETEALKKQYIGLGFYVQSDFDGRLTMTNCEWPFNSVVIDRTKGYIVDFYRPE